MIGTPYTVAWGDGNGGTITITQEGQTLSLRSAVATGWIYGTIWMWNADVKAWIKSTVHAGTTLDPWTGYWIHTLVDDLALNFSETPGLPGLLSGLLPMDGTPMADPPTPWEPSIEFTALRVVNRPNPVTDGHSTVFRVLGICSCSVKGLRVKVYDLAGYLVWEGDTVASYLPWNTLSTFGGKVGHLAVVSTAVFLGVGAESGASPVRPSVEGHSSWYYWESRIRLR
jgi:hypothetical protein